ncbi:hypothetical protein J2Z34_000494 [Youngiibacter multivorans]|uniref:Uncharacterized protein n=1 Tax=Youngiibacter multivorans TaxID=937251 RepID=A0ABS4G0E2_9CLOT|nr:hypothetical protein [Youngiibacter multivorans]
METVNESLKVICTKSDRKAMSHWNCSHGGEDDGQE